ncbi:MAG TPA: GGDEF domain-containing protein [Actinoplanes sp.]|nr:GGDEF domain-containing protein [Actinoplanes sp.]
MPVLIVLALIVLGALVATVTGVIGAVVWPALAVLCAVAAVGGFRIHRTVTASTGERRLWGAVGIAATVFSVSDSWQFVEYLRDPASTAAAIGGPVYSAGIVGGTVCMVGALLAMPFGIVTRHERVRFLLDAATVLVFAATLGCYFTVTAGASGTAGAGRTISLLFGPAIYMVGVFALIKLLLMPVKPFTPLAGGLLSASAALEGAATGFRPMLITHGLVPWHQAATLVAVAALAGAVWVQHRQTRIGPPTRPRTTRRPYSLLPYAAVAGTFALLIGVLVMDGWQSATWITMAGAVSSSALVLVRQVIAFADNARLLTLLDAKVAELHRSLAERDRLASELEHLAFHDALTGLANRVHFQRELDGHGAGRAVLLIDLDDFKPINDTYGHAAGDAVLAAVALRLRAAAGPGDLVARLGGDEFALLSAGPLTEDEAHAKAEALTAQIRLPMTVRGHEVRVGASIGFATGADGQTGEALLHEADIAMYWNKRSASAPEQDVRRGEPITRVRR